MPSLGMSLALVAILATILGPVSCQDETPIWSSPLYTEEDFKRHVPAVNHFVMFFAPWCGHCQRLEPTWEQLAELLNVEDSRVKIARVDCNREDELCSQHDVTGYPTLKFFKVGEAEGIRFRGIRDLPTLSSFINEQIGDKTVEEELTSPIEPAPLVELTEDTFFAHVASGNHFVKFYAPWCGHCQKLAPAWEKLADSLATTKTVSVSKIDCTQYRSVCTQFEVKGYPTLLWIEDGKKIEKYSGSRSHEDLKEYVSKRLSIEFKEEKKPDETISKGQAVMILTLENFEQGIQSGYVFVKFYAPWCGHCKRMSPTWDELGRKFIDHDKVKIAKIDCSVESNKKMCAKYEVFGYPTIFLYKNGVKLSEYEGSRSLDDLYEYVTEKVRDTHDEL